MAVRSHDMVEVHRVLAHPSKEIKQKMVQAMGIVTTSQGGACKVRLQVKAKRQAARWNDGLDQTGSNGAGDEYLDVKPGEGQKRRGSAARRTGAGARAAAGITDFSPSTPSRS